MTGMGRHRQERERGATDGSRGRSTAGRSPVWLSASQALRAVAPSPPHEGSSGRTLCETVQHLRAFPGGRGRLLKSEKEAVQRE